MNREYPSLLLAATALILATADAKSEPVELRLRGSELVIKGDLVSTQGNAAILSSPAFGMMMVEVDRYDCTGPGCAKLGQGETFGIYGSNTIGEALTPALIEAYAETRKFRVEKRVGASAEEIQMELLDERGKKLVLIDAQSHGSGTSFPGLMSGKAEIGASSRPIKDKELQDLTAAGHKLNTHVLALDGLPIIISPSNPVKELTLEQIAKIFSGQVTDWSQVGGTAGEISLYARDDKSGTYDTFNTLMLAPFKLKLSPKAKRFESSVELSDSVTRDPNGIGFIGFAYLRNAKALTIGSACGISSEPTEFNIKNEEYALSRRLYYYTTDKLQSQHASALLSFSLSDDAQLVVAESGFINQKIDVLPFSGQAGRLAAALAAPPEDFDLALMKQLTQTLKGASRLSVTFRFEKNSGNLDEKARQDVQRLARYLQSDETRGKQIILSGFADAAGPFLINSAVSQSRADAVRTALGAASNGALDASRFLVKGFGELMPVDCNTTEEGKAKNRRVEVWLKG